jgi:hypothetical protein
VNYVEAPAEYLPDSDRSVFLAGGISGCPPWQWRVAQMLAGTELTVINPRRETWPQDPTAAEQQIRWEFRHLRRATARLFWFPAETLCPITLYELGGATASEGPLFVGVEPAYARRFDVEVQTKLARPDVRVVYSLEDLAAQVIAWAAPLGETAAPIRTVQEVRP